MSSSTNWCTEDPKINLSPLLSCLMRLGVDPYNASFIDANDLGVDMPGEEERIFGSWGEREKVLKVL